MDCKDQAERYVDLKNEIDEINFKLKDKKKTFRELKTDLTGYMKNEGIAEMKNVKNFSVVLKQGFRKPTMNKDFIKKCMIEWGNQLEDLEEWATTVNEICDFLFTKQDEEKIMTHSANLKKNKSIKKPIVNLN